MGRGLLERRGLTGKGRGLPERARPSRTLAPPRCDALRIGAAAPAEPAPLPSRAPLLRTRPASRAPPLPSGHPAGPKNPGVRARVLVCRR